MNRKLSWNEITSHFSGQWVELVDCDWDWKDANPKSARVRNFSSDRKKLISKDNKDSVIMLVSGSMSILGSYNESNSSGIAGSASF